MMGRTGFLPLERQRIYGSKINVSLHSMWEGGVRVRLSDEVGGYN